MPDSITREEMIARFDAVDARHEAAFGQVLARLDIMNARIDTLSMTLSTRIDALDKRIDTLDKRIDDTRHDLSDLRQAGRANTQATIAAVIAVGLGMAALFATMLGNSFSAFSIGAALRPAIEDAVERKIAATPPHAALNGRDQAVPSPAPSR